jgi:large subunit ribosomal protein L22
MAEAYMIERQQASARAMGKDLSVSSKQCIEICGFLRGKALEKGIATLERVQKKREAIPFRRFTNGLGHKPGEMAAGRYPIKASTEILKLLRNAKANASAQGLTGELVISHIAANRAAMPLRNRSKHRGQFKRTHVEVVVIEASAGKAGAGKRKAKQKPEAQHAPDKAEKKAAQPRKQAPKKSVPESGEDKS